MTPFTINNLPYGIISTNDTPVKRCAVAFEDVAIDLDMLYRDDFFISIANLSCNIFAHDSWNAFAILPSDTRASVRARIKSGIQDRTVNKAMVPLSQVQCHLPMITHNFSDFSCAFEHMQNCSKVLNMNMPRNFFALPPVYNGRTSSLVVSGTPVTRPYGIFPNIEQDNAVEFQPESRMDFELEVGIWLSKPVPSGQRLNIAEAEAHIFGFTLLNDWSARTIQGFEMTPLGPFHSKGTATTVSPWIVPMEALEATKSERRMKQDPPALLHLTQDETNATFDIDLSVKLLRDGKSYTLCESNLNELHWTPVQQLTHLASAGSGLYTGDVFGTGTVSSDQVNTQNEKIGLGCIFERTLADTKLKSLPTDLAETFLKDNDEIIMEGWCRDKATGKVILGFGACQGKLLSAVKC